jgi:Asp-tRNA(Asn)/Glu-tRNA(Gln) amidotransferase A subunit family amidase
VWYGGMTRNPWKPSTGSSGSSAGPGAATAAGLVGFAIGSETLGSIISPCITNGVTGLRPTYGRVSRFGAMPLARTMDKLGPMSRGVEDCAMVLSAIHGADEEDPSAAADIPFRWDPSSSTVKSLRLGFDKEAFDSIAKISKSAGKKNAIAQALETIRGLAGGDLRPISLPPTDRYTGLASLIIACESACSFTELLHTGRVRELTQQGEDAWPNTFRKGSLVPASDYLRAMQLRTLLMRDMAAALADVDLYVTVPYQGPTVAYTNLTGHPTIITRCGMADGLPVSIEFVGRLYREDAILRAALAYEQATQWNRHWPDTEKLPPL